MGTIVDVLRRYGVVPNQQKTIVNTPDFTLDVRVRTDVAKYGANQVVFILTALPHIDYPNRVVKVAYVYDKNVPDFLQAVLSAEECVREALQSETKILADSGCCPLCRRLTIQELRAPRRCLWCDWEDGAPTLFLVGEWESPMAAYNSFMAAPPESFIFHYGSHDLAWRLLDVLAQEPLDPKFEKYGNFISVGGVTEQGTPLYPAGTVVFWGNFWGKSFVFNIATNHPPTIKKLTAAIRANQETPAYVQAKAEIVAEMTQKGAAVRARVVRRQADIRQQIAQLAQQLAEGEVVS